MALVLRVRLPTVLLVLLAGVPAAVAAGGAAVVGSFAQVVNAEAAATSLRSRLALPAEIVPADVGGKTIYRVLVRSDDGRDLVSRLRVAGHPDAWYLPDAPAVLESPSAPLVVPVRPVTYAAPRNSPAPAAVASDASTPAAVTAVRRSEGEESVAGEEAVIARGLEAGEGAVSLIETIDDVPRHHIAIRKFSEAESDIVIDGRVEEAVWQSVQYYDNMTVAVPFTGEPGGFDTHMRMFATEKGLYISAVMEQPVESLVARMSQRDDFIDRDLFGITLDATGDGQVGYWFIVGLGDSIMDGKVLPERNYQRDWDGPWAGKTARLADGWSVEMYLPWSMMSLAEVDGPRTMGFAAQRNVSFANERYQWPGHAYSAPRFVSALNTFEVEGVRPRQQISIIPYTSTTVDQAREEDTYRVGLDVTWRPSPKLELSAALAPDFGGVEADDIILNLTAAETFFPEKRLFFLEGNEIFETARRASMANIMRVVTNTDFATTSRRTFSRGFMPTPISLMNTRRIGGTASQATVPAGVSIDRGERDRPTDLIGAVKLAGKLGGVRYGVLAAVEDDVEWRGTDTDGNRVRVDDEGRDFFVSRFLYEGTGASRGAVGYLGTLVAGPRYDAAVHGIDAHRAWGSVQADTQLVMSDVDGTEGYGAMFDVSYSPSAAVRHKFELDYLDEDVDFSDLGFLRRNDNVTAQYALMYSHNKGFGPASNVRGTVILRQEYNVSKGQVTDSGIFWRNSLEVPGRNTIRTAFAYLPERWEDINSRGNGAYRANDRWWVETSLATDAGRAISMSFVLSGLQEDLGGWTYEASAGATIRPGDRFSLDFDLSYRRKHGWMVYQGGRNFGAFDADEWQPRARLNWFIAPGHELKFSFQWVGVRAIEDGFFAVPAGDGDLVVAARTRASHDFTVSMLTSQLRYRWEIAPLTDFFLVYNRGNSLPNTVDHQLRTVFRDVFSDPIIDSFIAKFRYRFGD